MIQFARPGTHHDDRRQLRLASASRYDLFRSKFERLEISFEDCPQWAKKVVLRRRIMWFPSETGDGPSDNHAWYIWDWRHEGPPTIVYGPNSGVTVSRVFRSPGASVRTQEGRGCMSDGLEHDSSQCLFHAWAFECCGSEVLSRHGACPS